MKLKKYVKTALLSSILALGLSVSALEAGALDGSIIKAYAKKKVTKKVKNKIKKDKKVLKKFEPIVEGKNKYETSVYTDGKNNKIYISVEDFFNNLKGTTKEAGISINTKKKSVKVNIGKKNKNKYNNIDLPKSIYGKLENIKLDIDGKKTEVKGFIVKYYYFWSSVDILYVDFDELAEKFDLLYEKDMSKKKYLLYTKLPENVVELKSDKSTIESYSNDLDTLIASYDINGRWAHPIENYLYEENANLIRVEAIDDYDKKEDSRVSIKRYDSSGNLLEIKELPYQGEKFGGFYKGEEYNYLIFGNNNEEKNDGKEVVRIVKFDREFNELGSVSVNGAYTVYPFAAGSLRCAEIGQTILIHTSRQRYDGHQSQLTIAFNEYTMSLLNADDLGDFQRNHASHDFNQFAMADGNEFIVVDHGDGFPRGIKVSWIRTEALEPEKRYTVKDGLYAMIDWDMFSLSKTKEILNIPGERGANQTGVSIGSALHTANKVLVGVNRIDYSKATGFDSFDITGKDVDKRDVVLYSLDKNTLEVVENKYTDYTLDKNTTYTAPKMVKLDETRIMLIWNQLNLKSDKSVLQYLIVDENGNKLSEIKTLEDMKIADEAPIIYNNKVVWSEYRKGRLILNSIPLE
ncbi:MAG: hypothetical protein ACTTKP_00625 [Catonella sp.]|uniref:hypothetical protein n=1 Tax=Catonella sp. TaxID=2382125 RepID=UPI003FA17BBA